MLRPAHVEVNHGIRRPVLLQPADGQPAEQLALPSEVAVQRGDQQRLPEPARTAEEEIAANLMGETVDVFRLVDVEKVLLANRSKVWMPIG